MTRRYFKYSIIELEQLFEKSKNDPTVLEDMREELGNRKTSRAKTLANRVNKQIINAGREKTGDENNSRTPEIQRTELSNQAPTNGDTNTSRQSIGVKNGVLESPVVPIDFGNPEPILVPEVVSKPGADSILAAWLTLEVLSPQVLPDARELETIGRTLVSLDQYPEPWKESRFWKRGRERSVYWMVYLGELDLAKATNTILKKYPDESIDERLDIKGTTTLAVLIVDSYGRPIEDKTFLSSFAWGYGQLCAGRLKSLASFPESEHGIKDRLEKHLIRQDEDGKIVPLTNTDIIRAIDWLGQVLNLPKEEVLKPGVAIRVPQWGIFNEPPEPELLNSFFINDLVKVRSAFNSNQVGNSISNYMRGKSDLERKDIVKNENLISETLSPIRIPLARWPDPGRYSLVLMQQAAINHSVMELLNGGVVAVNGPPGTGKTTLLRDIVAKVVLDRAIAMSKFDKPIQAFSHTTSMKTGQAYTHLYQIDQSLLDHEIVVASSNNKAVENISREIPSASAIAADISPPPKYFQSISDAVLAGKNPIIDGSTWGLVAAVLGNSANRSAFVQSFWWHKKRGMALYLKAVLGVDILEDEGDENEENDEEKILDVVTIEKPPRGEIEAIERWNIARRSFISKLKYAEDLRTRVHGVYEAVTKRPALLKLAHEIASRLESEKTKLESAERNFEVSKQRHAKLAQGESRAIDDKNAIDRLRPGFFARLFWSRSYRVWRSRFMKALNILDAARLQVNKADEITKESEKALLFSKKIFAELGESKKNADDALAKITSTIEEWRYSLGENLADEEFWRQPDSILQLRSPWIFKEWQDVRDSLFIEALALHRAFIDAAAKPLRHNLRAALDVMKGRVLKEQQEAVRRSLWASLFLVVPVISTTFASVSRLFGPLGKEQIGWLLVDEAGQAVPQAAVGAMWRAKRTIVIGDPLQLQPVVSTPSKLVRAIFSEFGVDTEEWAAPQMSAQTLADRVSWFGTNIMTDDGDIWVGSPLRVHRRCENPMFKISNHVAYDGLMVYGTPSKISEIGKILGESLWINVESESVGKWSETEGKYAISLLKKLLDAGMGDPDVFFITPFRNVANELRKMIRDDKSITDRLPKKAWDWTRDRVGTIHTFQGKEADSVIIILGAPSEASAGARHWAGHPPNLLNVAITRAKRRIYVIGNREAWKNSGAFTHLAQMLPIMGRPSESDMTQVPRHVSKTVKPISETPIKFRDSKIVLCSSCGAPAMPGDNVCYQCKSD